MKKELFIYMGIFLFLAIGMHFKEWLSHPLDHLLSLPKAGAYGIGALHPLLFTTIVYIVVLIFRLIWGLIRKPLGNR